MKSYIYKPNCKNCLKLTGDYFFTCGLCGFLYAASVKEIGKKEKLIYCRCPGAPYLEGDFYQRYWKKEFSHHLVEMK